MAQTMSGRDRILSTLTGEKPDRVPFVPNIWQWFYVNQYNQTLPSDLLACQDPVDVLRTMDADIFSKFDGIVDRVMYRNCRHTVTFEGGLPSGRSPWASFTTFDAGLIRKDRIETPHGVLSHVWEYRETSGAPFESKHWFEDFESEYPAIRFLLENIDIELKRDLLANNVAKIGEDGVILLQLLPTPLKQFHWLAGQEKATFFLIDHPTEMQELARIWEQKSLAWLEQVVDIPDIVIFEVPDNLDSFFYPPYWYEAFCMPILKRQAGMIHARGKYLFQHACGHLKALAPLIIQSGLDCVEGQAAPPLGDWHLHEARALSERLIICGGMAAPQQELTAADAQAQIDRHVHDLFLSMGDKRRFFFGSSCNTSPQTPYENLLAFRDAARTHSEL
ncbi:MAG: hypothetical protein GY759_10640 [Chloroflexi bacterium]|nr:hypothetical protein [Chloroflexota bacterium]